MVASKDNDTRSAWMDVPAPDYAPLGEDAAADVCVVGAGIAGLTTAYCLAARRQERRRARRRARRRRHDAADDRAPLERARRPLRRDRAAARPRRRAPRGREPHGGHRPHRGDRAARSASTATSSGSTATSSRRPARRRSSSTASSRPRGAPGSPTSSESPRAPLGAFDTGPCLRFPRQAQFHPGKYLPAWRARSSGAAAGSSPARMRRRFEAATPRASRRRAGRP